MSNTINILKPSVCFEVQKIVGISANNGNCKAYQVQWAPSWISGVHLIGCEDLIEQFELEQNKRNIAIKVEAIEEHAVIFDNENDNDGNKIMEDSNEKDVFNEDQCNISDIDSSDNCNMGSTVKVVSSDSSFHSEDETIQSIPGNTPDSNSQPKQTNTSSFSNSGQGETGQDEKGEYMVLSFEYNKLTSKDSECDDTTNTDTCSGNRSIKHSPADGDKLQQPVDRDKLPQPVAYYNKEGTMHMVAIQPTNQNRSKKLNICKEQLTCSVCYKTFFSTLKWEMHTAKAHRYQCDLCEKSFRDTTDLNRHRRVHTGERPFKCNVCQKRFRTAYYVKRHCDIQHIQENISSCDIQHMQEDIPSCDMEDMQENIPSCDI